MFFPKKQRQQRVLRAGKDKFSYRSTRRSEQLPKKVVISKALEALVERGEVNGFNYVYKASYDMSDGELVNVCVSLR